MAKAATPEIAMAARIGTRSSGSTIMTAAGSTVQSERSNCSASAGSMALSSAATGFFNESTV